MPSRTPTDIWRCQRLILAARKGETTCQALHEQSIEISSSLKWFEEISEWMSKFPESGLYISTTIWTFLEGVPNEHRIKYDRLIRHYITYIQQLVPARLVSILKTRAVLGNTNTERMDDQ
ncbi:hypothetical protein B0I75DRAFT_144114 [Yarrowia lipolytica]|nr:hypothetical protein B0I74DRAFT_78376 [Yarrowia lipolytica]RDW54945.1 hypothetical protein B0I75DRAFT_144114 [Yarrowia lipolytica]